jgi:hypothetical protein
MSTSIRPEVLSPMSHLPSEFISEIDSLPIFLHFAPRRLH